MYRLMAIALKSRVKDAKQGEILVRDRLTQQPKTSDDQIDIQLEKPTLEFGSTSRCQNSRSKPTNDPEPFE